MLNKISRSCKKGGGNWHAVVSNYGEESTWLLKSDAVPDGTTGVD